MGNWNINIQGTGCHHNNNPKIDADQAAIQFVAKLREMGLIIESATFTSGSKADLFEASQPKHSGVKVFINSAAVDNFPATASFEQVCDAAGFKEGSSPTVIYINGRFGKEGILSKGQLVESIDGTRFSAVFTGNA